MPRWRPLDAPLLAGALASFPGRRVARIIADSRVVRVKIIQTLLLNVPLAVLGVIHARGTLQGLQRGLTTAICAAVGLPAGDSPALGGLESASAAAIASLVLLPFLLVATVISTVWCGQIVREAVRLTTTTTTMATTTIPAAAAAAGSSAARSALPTPPQRTPRSSLTGVGGKATPGGVGPASALASAAAGGVASPPPTSPPPPPPPAHPSSSSTLTKGAVATVPAAAATVAVPPPPAAAAAHVAAPRSPLLEAAEAIYRLLILTVLNILVPVVDGVTAPLLPWHIGRGAAVLLCALSIGFAAWDTVWSHQARALEWRCTAVEDTPAFYVGFGLATALATYWPNAYTSAAVYAIMLPWLTLAALLHDKRQQALATAAAGRGGSPAGSNSSAAAAAGSPSSSAAASHHGPKPGRRPRGWLLRPVRWLLNGILWGLERLLASTTHAAGAGAAPPPPPRRHGDSGDGGSSSSSSSKRPPR